VVRSRSRPFPLLLVRKMSYSFRKDDTRYEKKVWGEVKHFVIHKNLLASRLFVHEGFECSVHSHSFRFNHFLVKTGKIVVDIWERSEKVTSLAELADYKKTSIVLLPDDSLVVFPLIFHRFRVRKDGEVFETYWSAASEFLSFLDINRLSEGGAY